MQALLNIFTVFIYLNMLSFHCICSQDSDVGSFLTKMMRDYVPKNTRHYTLYNGQPIYSGLNPPTDRDISRTLLAPSSNVFMNSLVPEGPSPFMNYNPWTPAVSPTASSPSFFSSIFGRGNNNNQDSAKAQEKSEIITADDVQLQQANGYPDIQEFKIQSTMTF